MSSISDPSRIDRRAARTRALLADALMELGAERGIDAIEIGDLTETAGIGRSTFYAHFSSKQDFLTASFANMIAMQEAEAARQAPDRTDVLPSSALFAHVHAAAHFARTLPASEEYPRMMRAGELKLRDIVSANLQRLNPDWSFERRRETAIYVAAGFMGLLRWWMESGVQRTPVQMQSAFSRLASNALADD